VAGAGVRVQACDMNGVLHFDSGCGIVVFAVVVSPTVGCGDVRSRILVGGILRPRFVGCEDLMFTLTTETR
jgi:hypothetical protein